LSFFIDNVGRKVEKIVESSVPEEEIRNELALAHSRERASFVTLAPNVQDRKIQDSSTFDH